MVQAEIERLDIWDATLDIRAAACAPEDIVACADDPEEITVLLPAGDYFIVVDGWGGASVGPYLLHFDILPVICEEGSRRCNADDSVEVCADGVAWELHHDCPAGRCDRGRCLYAHDRCAAHVPRLRVGQPVEGSTRDAGNDYAGTCTVGITPDVAYRFFLADRTGVSISMTPDFRSHFFVRADCEDPTTEVACTDPVNAGGTTTFAGVLDGGTYFVVVDGVGIDPENAGEFELLFETYEPVCDPETTWCEGTFLRTCAADGMSFETVECPGACEDRACTIGNDDCDSPQVLVEGRWFNGDLRAAAPDYEGSCGGSGSDVVYTFTVPERGMGVRLLLLAVSGDLFYHLRLGACHEPQGHRSEVFCGADFAGALDAGEYFLIVDAQEGDEGEFGLGYETFEMACEPDSTECVQDGDLTFFRVCNEEGSEFEDVECEGLCDPENGCLVEGDTCDIALPIELGVPVEGDTTGAANYYEHGSTGDCEWGGGEGGDVAYTFNLDQETGVTITLTREVEEVCEFTCPYDGDGDCDDGGPGSDFSICALGTDCSDCGPRMVGWPVNVDLRGPGCDEEEILGCIDHDPVQFHAILPAGDYYIIVDGDGPEDAGAFELLVEEGMLGVCDPNTKLCTEEGFLARCNAEGTDFEILDECAYGCVTEEGDASCDVGCEANGTFCTEDNEIATCNADGTGFAVGDPCDGVCVVNDQGVAQCVDPCAQAEDLVPGETAGDLAGASPFLERSCAGWDVSGSQEVLYTFVLDELSFVELTVAPGATDTDEAWNPVIELRSTACLDDEAEIVACLDDAEEGEAETFAGELLAGVYYLMVESYDTIMVSGEYCEDTCRFSGDGDCDDGGPDSDYSFCALGTDCTDCGPRVVVGWDNVPFTVDFSATVRVCEPLTRWCDGSLAYTCSEDGTEEIAADAACDALCIDGLCVPANDTCATAAALVSREVVEDDTFVASNDAAGSCAIGNAGDLVYTFTVDEQTDGVIIEFDADFSGYYYIRKDDCADPAAELTCEMGSGGRYWLDPGTYYLFVDGYVLGGGGEICENTCRWAFDGACDDGGPGSAFSLCELGTDCGDCGPRMAGGREGGRRGEFTLTYTVYDAVCDAGEIWCDGDELHACNEDGTQEDVQPCPLGCDAEAAECIYPDNDLCDDAVELQDGVAVDGNTLGGRHEFEGESCDGLAGPDIWYTFTVDSCSGVAITLTPAGDADLALGLKDACDRAELLCVDDAAGGEVEALGTAADYFMLSAGTYYLAVDSVEGPGGEFTIQLDIDPEQHPEEDCLAGNDLCEDAESIDASGVQVIPGDSGDAGNEYNASRGPDVWYTFELVERTAVEILMDSDPAWDTYLYLLGGGCDDLTEIESDDDLVLGQSSQIDQRVLDPGTYFIVATGYGAAHSGPFTLTVTFSEPPAVLDCDTPGELAEGLNRHGPRNRVGQWGYHDPGAHHSAPVRDHRGRHGRVGRV